MCCIIQNDVRNSSKQWPYLPEVKAGEGIIVTSVNGKICACNHNAEKILGYTISQMQEWSSSNQPAKTIYPDGLPFPRKLYPTTVALETGKPCLNVEMGFYKPNGELIGLRLNACPLFKANQSAPDVVVTTFVDIPLDTSQIKELTAKTPPLKAQFATFLENIPDVVFRLDRNLNYIYISPNLGCESKILIQQFLGKTGRELGFPVDACNLFESTCYQALVTGRMTSVEYSIDGKKYLSRIIPERGVDGAVKSLLGITENITERKQVENAVQESEEKFQQLAENITEAVFWIVERNKTIYVSQAYERIWGRSCSSLYANCDDWFDAIHPEDRKRVEVAFCEQELTGRYDQEYRIIHPDGKQRWVHSRGFPIRDPSGKPYRVVGIAEDITERKRWEQEREEILACERVARGQAERSNRIKDEFLGIVSHELRTPLSPIISWAVLLRKGKLNLAQTAEAVKSIECNANILIHLIDDLLDVSRILQGKIRLNLCPVNLTSTILTTVEIVRLTADIKSIQLTTEIDQDMGEVKGDPNRLQQIVWNLLSNAVKFTPFGGEFWFECQRRSELRT